MNDNGFVHDVAVIGAGLSGLTAAHRLREAGRDVVVLEAADRIGGRLLRQHIAGVAVDGGGAWVGPTQDRVLSLIDELGLTTSPTYCQGRHLFRLRGRVRSGTGDVPPLPLLGLADTALAFRRLDRLARRLPRRAEALDAITVGQWMRRHLFSHGGRTLLRIAVGTTTGADVDDLSMYAFVTHVRSAGGIVALTGVQGAAQDARVVGGSVSICERLVERIGRHRVRLSAPVAAIIQHDDQVAVRLRAGQPEVLARRVIVAVDPAGCSNIDFGDALPAARRRLHFDWTMGSGIKVHIAYPTAFWRAAGLSGQAYADDGLMRVMFDATPADGGPGVLVGFLGGASIAEPAILRPEFGEQRIRHILGELVGFFGPMAAEPTGYIEQDWSAQPFLAGCVPALRPGVLTAAGQGAAEPWGRVHWAGAESAETWEGHMDGAVRSGERAALAAA